MDFEAASLATQGEPVLLTGVPWCDQPEVRAGLAGLVGEFQRVEELSGGVNHHVHRVTGARGTVVTKHRGQESARVPGAHLDPEDLRHEVEALRRVAGSPLRTPQVLDYWPSAATVALTDVAGPGLRPGPEALATMDDAALAGFTRQIGHDLARTHLAWRAQPGLRSAEAEVKFLQRSLFERLTYHGRPGSDRLAQAVRALPGQLVLGDLSPKNLLIGEDGYVAFDFEHVHTGPRVFDLAFVLAHVLLHAAQRPGTTAAMLMETLSHLTDAYGEEAALDAPSQDVLPGLVAALVCYRTRNDWVRYDLPWSGTARESVTEALLSMLDRGGLSLGSVVGVVSSAVHLEGLR
jgi:hypothetical protein